VPSSEVSSIEYRQIKDHCALLLRAGGHRLRQLLELQSLRLPAVEGGRVLRSQENFYPTRCSSRCLRTHSLFMRSLEIAAYPPVKRMQPRPRAAEKQPPSASSKTEEQVDLRASCFPGNAPSHEVLAVIESRVIEILPDAGPCPLDGFFP
jgi:hypothetical protein